MGFESRNGKRKLRSELTNRRKPELGYYLIVTDTEGTERVYFNGLRDSIKDVVGDKLIIKVVETKNRNMIKEAKEFLAELPQYAEPWIVFDKDENVRFNKIIEDAENSGVKVAWSNPCIETWFNAYFGKMPNCQDSVSCCNTFSNEYKKHVGQEYHKADAKLYAKLYGNGNEEKAIEIADKKMKEHSRNCNTLPSEMIPATTVYKLVEEIKKKM